MEIVSAHSHLLSDPKDLDRFVESGPFSQVWLLGLPHSIKISEQYPHPSTEAELLEVAERYPGFFLPFKWVDFRKGPDQIDRAVEKGFIGFKGDCPQKPYDDDSYMPIYERINHYRSCMVFHTGYVLTPSYVDRVEEFEYSVRNMHPETMYKIARFFPDMILVAAHFGGTWERELIARPPLDDCPNLYIDFSGGDSDTLLRHVENYASLPAALVDGTRGILANRLLFGADAFLGDAQLHRDVKRYTEGIVEHLEALKEKKLPWTRFMDDLFSGNSKKIMDRNGLYRKP